MIGRTLFLLLLCRVCLVGSRRVSGQSVESYFFLRDANDGQCFAGNVFQRCSNTSLWFISSSGSDSYNFHLKQNGRSQCLSRSQATENDTQLMFSDCDVVANWNLLGDPESGYFLTDGEACINRHGNSAVLINCDDGRTTFSVQFITLEDIRTMSSKNVELLHAIAFRNESAISFILSQSEDLYKTVNAQDWDGQTPVMVAAGLGELSVVKQLVDAGADLNARDKEGISALMEAAANNHTGVVEYLCGIGADVDATSVSGVTALWLASAEGHDVIVSFLLSENADTGISRQDGITPLMVAASQGLANTVSALVQSGLNVNDKDNEGASALIHAAEYGDSTVVRLLLSHAADINYLSENQFSPLIVASAHGHMDVVRLLVEYGGDVNFPHPEGVTALMYASASGHQKIVSYLLGENADPNAKHSLGGTALIEAATGGHLDVVEELVKAGADINVVDSEGVNALMSACAKGHSEVARYLLSHAVDLDLASHSGGTALIYAASKGYTDIVAALLSAGADINIAIHATDSYLESLDGENNDVITEATGSAIGEADTKEVLDDHREGATALMAACEGGHMDTVRLLVESGANVHIPDASHISPLVNTVRANFTEITHYLLRNGANPNDPFIDNEGSEYNLLLEAVYAKDSRLAQLLIEYGALVNATDNNGTSVLVHASALGLDGVVRDLLGKDNTLIMSNEDRVTALIVSVQKGYAEVVKVLLRSHGVSANSRDDSQSTALMVAAAAGYPVIVEILLQFGAQVDAQNSDGHTAFMFATHGQGRVEHTAYLVHRHRRSGKQGLWKDELRVIQDQRAAYERIISTLRKYGANENIRDSEGHIASDFSFSTPKKSKRTTRDETPAEL